MSDHSFTDRLKHAWNAFTGNDRQQAPMNIGYASSLRPDRPRVSFGNDKSMVSAIYTRLSIDVAAVKVQHVRLNQNGSFKEKVDSGLNNCLALEANIDQTGRALMQDIALSLFDEGVVAIVPVETTTNPKVSEAYDIRSLRTGQILEWYPKHVKVRVYNDNTGYKEELVLPKHMVAIVENPLYSVMNEPNSTLQRLIRKLNLLDAADEKANSGKLDIIVQLPYTIKSKSRQEQAERRRKDIEAQLTGSRYGIAYMDATEKITQLNRPAENNLLEQIEYLTSMLYGQLGLTEEVFNGTASEAQMNNYYHRTIEPIITAITEAMERTFLSKTARTQGQSIMWFRDPFRLVTARDMADIADRFSRNEILTSNEIRGIIGIEPSEDPRADELLNKNISDQHHGPQPGFEDEGQDQYEYEDQQEVNNQNGI